MSASLVGSEMCIRDRCVGCHSETLRLLTAESSSGPDLMPPQGGRQFKPCLLYTSDAADDM
eukprot:11383258-Alexandrium_andersonii.AAC.1